VVDHHDDLVRRKRLLAHRGDRLAEQIPPPFVVGADDDGEVAPHRDRALPGRAAEAGAAANGGERSPRTRVVSRVASIIVSCPLPQEAFAPVVRV
jgi:hypothetical protein